MSRLLSLLMCLSFTLPSFASESLSEIAAQKQFQKNIDSYQKELSKVKANDAFKADMIEKALSNKENTIAALEQSSAEKKQELIAKIEKDTDEKVALMQDLDPQTLKDMAIMDVQKVQTSMNAMFPVLRSFYFGDDSMLKPSYEACKRGRTDYYGNSCATYGLMIAISPVLFTIGLGLDLVSLPVTFIISATTGF